MIKAGTAKVWIGIFSLLVIVWAGVMVAVDQFDSEPDRPEKIERPIDPLASSNAGPAAAVHTPSGSVTIYKLSEGSGYRFEVSNTASRAIDVPLFKEETLPDGSVVKTSLSVTVLPTEVGKGQLVGSWDGKTPGGVDYVIENDDIRSCKWHW
jgi:hypothetical protein